MSALHASSRPSLWDEATCAQALRELDAFDPTQPTPIPLSLHHLIKEAKQGSKGSESFPWREFTGRHISPENNAACVDVDSRLKKIAYAHLGDVDPFFSDWENFANTTPVDMCLFHTFKPHSITHLLDLGCDPKIERYYYSGRRMSKVRSIQTPLHNATAAGQYKAMQVFLSRTVTALDVEGPWVKSVLHLAAESGDLKAVEMLLEDSRVDCDKEFGPKRVTALSLATQGNHSAVITALLDHGADPNIAMQLDTDDMCPPICLAMELGHDGAVVALLADKRTDCNTRMSRCKTAAVFTQNLKYLQLVLKHPRTGPNIVNGFYQNTSLHQAAEGGDVEVMKLFCKHPKTDLNKTNAKGETPLYCALFRKQYEAAALLLRESETNPNQETHDRKTSLTYAVTQEDSKAVELLFENKKTDPHLQDAFHRAAASGSVEVLKLFCDLPKTEHNRLNKDNATVLHCALANGQIETARLLLNDSKISDITADEEGKTLLHWLVGPKKQSLSYWAGKSSVVCRTVPQTIDIDGKDTDFLSHVEDSRLIQNKSALVQLLLDKGFDPNSPDKAGRTPLHHAVFAQSFDAIGTLLADPRTNSNWQDGDRRTPLHHAVMGSYPPPDIARCLLAHRKTTLEIRDKDGRTPLQCVADDYVDEGMRHAEIIWAFGQKTNTDPLTKISGYTPLHQAAKEDGSYAKELIRDCKETYSEKNRVTQTPKKQSSVLCC